MPRRHIALTFLCCMLSIGLLSTTQAEQQNNAELRKSYLIGKSGRDKVFPKSRRDFVTCLTAWRRWGLVTINQPRAMRQIHPDLTEATADALHQHWWRRSVAAFGDQKQAFSKAFQQIGRDFEANNFSKGKLKKPMYWAGICFVEPPKRQRINKVTLRQIHAEILQKKGAARQQQQRKAAPARPTGPQVGVSTNTGRGAQAKPSAPPARPQARKPQVLKLTGRGTSGVSDSAQIARAKAQEIAQATVVRGCRQRNGQPTNIQVNSQPATKVRGGWQAKATATSDCKLK